MSKCIFNIIVTVAIIATVFASCASQTNSSPSNRITTDGSTSMEKVIGALGESYTIDNPQINFTFNPTGSGSGIAAVKEGRCDIGLSSRALKGSEKSAGLNETVFAYDGIAVVVNPSNPISDLTKEQISDIYTGKITNWKDVGGISSKIVVIGREAGSGTRDGFESATDTKNSCILRQELTSAGDVITSVAQNSSAIGYASLASVSKKVKAITVDKIEATESNIKDSSYPLQRPFVLVTRVGDGLSQSAQDFFNYATSVEAATIISSQGAIPAKSGE